MDRLLHDRRRSSVGSKRELCHVSSLNTDLFTMASGTSQLRN